MLLREVQLISVGDPLDKVFPVTSYLMPGWTSFPYDTNPSLGVDPSSAT